jgi:hypothetical protein
MATLEKTPLKADNISIHILNFPGEITPENTLKDQDNCWIHMKIVSKSI